MLGFSPAVAFALNAFIASFGLVDALYGIPFSVRIRFTLLFNPGIIPLSSILISKSDASSVTFVYSYGFTASSAATLVIGVPK